jgi:hypothetical protein
LYKHEGNVNKAREIMIQETTRMTQSLQVHPANPFQRGLLAICYGALGNREMLHREEVRLLKEEPESGMVLGLLGWAHAALGDNDRAVELMAGSLHRGSRYQIHGVPCPEVWGAESLGNSPKYLKLMEEFEATNARLGSRY